MNTLKTNFALQLYKIPQSVFTFKELSMLFPSLSYPSLKNKINYAVKTKKLITLRRGLYAKDNWNIFEAANKIYSPSYISLETVLKKEGVIFQEYNTVFLVSYLTRKIKVKNYEVFYRKLKSNILLNKEGITEENSYAIASCERAFLDCVFLYKNYHFDNLKPLNWEKIKKLTMIYESKSLKKRVEEYYQIYKKQSV